jgi:hypothetical protein
MPFTISPTPLQQILPSKPAARFEGLAYSADGSVLAAATADTNAALLFRRGAAKVTINDDGEFREINAKDKTEGGPKGIAIHGDEIAVCSPQIGIKIFRFSES